MGKSKFKDLVRDTINRLQGHTTPPDDLFDELAKLILGKGLLSVNEVKFQFKEIEFYLNNEEGKFDPYTHQHDGFPTGCFRPHESGLGADISIREKEGKFFGGVLMRGVQRGFEDDFIRGPFKTLMAILKELGNLETGGRIKLDFTETPYSQPNEIKITSRYNLVKAHSGEPNDFYKEKIGWRYHTYPNDHLSSKTSKIERRVQ